MAFLGLTGFYRRFIKDYAKLAFPFTALLRNDQFKWSPEAQAAFDSLKLAMTRVPVLSLPDFSAPFIIETNASGTGMGAVLSQHQHPIAFFSKQFCPKLLHSSTYIRELHAITTAVKRWRQYLLGHPFTILTDHKSLKDLMSQSVQTPEQHVYLSKLLGYDYTIQYKSGKSNVVADALSRVHDQNAEACWLLSMPRFHFLDDLKQELTRTPSFTELFNVVRNNPAAHPGYKIHNDLLLYKDRIWLNKGNTFIPLLLEEFHKSPLGGHTGLAKTLSRLQENFFWSGMR